MCWQTFQSSVHVYPLRDPVGGGDLPRTEKTIIQIYYYYSLRCTGNRWKNIPAGRQRRSFVFVENTKKKKLNKIGYVVLTGLKRGLAV